MQNDLPATLNVRREDFVSKHILWAVPVRRETAGVSRVKFSLERGVASGHAVPVAAQRRTRQRPARRAADAYRWYF